MSNNDSILSFFAQRHLFCHLMNCNIEISPYSTCESILYFSNQLSVRLCD